MVSLGKKEASGMKWVKDQSPYRTVFYVIEILNGLTL